VRRSDGSEVLAFVVHGRFNMLGTARTVKVAVVLCAAVFVGLGVGAPVHAVAIAGGDVASRVKPELPAGAVEIAAATKAAKVGETIAVRGNVARSLDAFDPKIAAFTLVDEALRSGPIPPDERLPASETAVPPEGRARVQIVDAGGRPIRQSLNGLHGLKPGAEVFVTGKVERVGGEGGGLVLSVVSMHVPRAGLPTGFFVEHEPGSAVDVSAGRKAGTMKRGDEVVLRGRIGGSAAPFVAGRAVFTIVGRALKPCNEKPDDHCPEPWDYCCDTKEDILANSVTVQVVDSRGRALRTDMKGRRGLKELSEVVVVGTVASADGGAVVVSARAVYAGP
jgi:hypothetical protein